MVRFPPGKFLMHAYLRHLRNFFVSLQLTVVLLVMSLILVFVATLDQVNLGIWAVQEKYFRSFLVFWTPQNSDLSIPLFPGGYLIGGLLLINLVCAHIYRFRLTWRKSGIQLAHAGLILLLLGELISGLLQKDSSMRLEEGETRKYSESFRDYELAVLDTTNPGFDEVVAIPDAILADGKSIQHPKLPFQLRVKEFHPNASLGMRDASSPSPSPATAGVGTRVAMTPLPVTYKPDEVNTPGAYVEIVAPEGSLGTWLVSPLLGAPQTFLYQGHTWQLTLRLKRFYYPFSIQLLKVTHEVYPGTEIPKNFASRVRVRSDDGKTDRETVVFMNNPLRFGGETFYQYQMNAASRMSVFQVVRNPGWLLPYVACVMMGVGLVLQFGFSLFGFIRKRTDAEPAAQPV
jgi:hypothetical protein